MAIKLSGGNASLFAEPIGRNCFCNRSMGRLLLARCGERLQVGKKVVEVLVLPENAAVRKRRHEQRRTAYEAWRREIEEFTPLEQRLADAEAGLPGGDT